MTKRVVTFLAQGVKIGFRTSKVALGKLGLSTTELGLDVGGVMLESSVTNLDRTLVVAVLEMTRAHV